MPVLRVLTAILLAAVMPLAAAPSEYQLKAVFLFNFSQFVEWPAQTLPVGDAPFTICVLGEDPFGAELDEAVRGEKVAGHSILVRRLQGAAAADACQILFIGDTHPKDLDRALGSVSGRAVLTVTEMDRSAERGAMIQFANERNRLRLRINVAAAKSAGLVISSKLLRPAEIVGPREG